MPTRSISTTARAARCACRSARAVPSRWSRSRSEMAELAAALDARDHRFGTGAPYTVGIEEEYMLLDPVSLDLAPPAEDTLAAEAGGEFGRHFPPELFEAPVEFHPPVSPDVPAAGRELRRLRAHA